MDRFDVFVESIEIPGLVVFVVIPSIPDDVVCFLAGLTKWRLRTFMIATAVGRLPAYALTVYAGGELAGERLFNAVLLIGVVVVLSGIGYYKQETIRDYVGRIETRFSF